MFNLLSCSLILFFLASCSKREEPCEIVQVRPLISYHCVKDGENLDSIARTYGMSVRELCKINGFEETSFLIVGQKIFITPQKISSIQSVQKPEISVEINNNDFENYKEEPLNQNNLNDDLQENTQNNLKQNDDLSYSNTEEKHVNEEIVYNHLKKFMWPVEGKILRKFNEKFPNGTISEGINISAPANVNVKACADGTILDAGELVLGFGKMIIISHDNGMISIYGHLQEIMVKRPQSGEKVQIKQGQTIGRVGKTGNVKTPQLHFQLRNEKKVPVDPLEFLND